MKFSDIPFDEIITAGNKSLLKNNIFNVNWLLGRYCNYGCSYCWPYANTKIKDHRSLRVIVNAVDTIVKHANEKGYDKFSFSFSGGEPTLHPNFLEIMEYICVNNSWINITTNFSRPISWFDKLLEIVPKLSITASYHPEFETKEFEIYG